MGRSAVRSRAEVDHAHKLAGPEMAKLLEAIARHLHYNESLHLHDYADDGPCNYCWLRAGKAIQAARIAGARLDRLASEELLAKVFGLSAAHRRDLLGTFLAWADQESGGLQAVADQLHVHLNTVRYRLVQLEELTGKSWRVPRQAAELLAAIDIVMQQDGGAE